MKKLYENLEIQIILFAADVLADVISASPNQKDDLGEDLWD